MIKFPENIEYKTEHELLYLFLTYSEELTNISSSHQLPVHNTLTLCGEAKSTFRILESHISLEDYWLYTKDGGKPLQRTVFPTGC